MIKKITKITLFSFFIITMICLLGCQQPIAPETTNDVKFSATGDVDYLDKITLSSATEGAKIYYTLDNTDPTTASTKYNNPIEIKENCTIKAIAVKDGNIDSKVVTASFNIKEYKVTFKFPDNTKPETAKYHKGLINPPSFTIQGANGIECWLTDDKKWDFSKDFITHDITLNVTAAPYTTEGALNYIKDFVKEAIQNKTYEFEIFKKPIIKYNLHIAYKDNLDITNFCTNLIKFSEDESQNGILFQEEDNRNTLILHHMNMYIYGINEIDITEPKFYKSTNVISVVELHIMKNIKSIGDTQFDIYENTGNNKLEKIVIKDGLTKIGNNAFHGHHKLTKLELPNTLISIGDQCFKDTYKLKSLQLPESLKTIGYQAFGYDNELTKVTIPNSVTEIGDEVFYGCISLNELNLSNNLKILPYHFINRTQIKEITVPKSVKRIHKEALNVSDDSNKFLLQKINFEDTSNPVILFESDNNENDITFKPTTDATYNCDKIKYLMWPSFFPNPDNK